ncbi:MAG: lysophospholipid acyltransferase family protein [Fimbriimonadaceae bacterium]
MPIRHPDFIFGRNRPFLRSFEVLAAGLANRWMFAVTETRLEGEFGSLPPGVPILFVSNHPRLSDPPSFYAVGREVPRLVYTVASRKLFDEGMGLLGVILKNIRCISIQRGSADLAAFKAMSQILVQPENALLVYPETEVAYGFDYLFPFQVGLFQLALGAEARSRNGLLVAPLGFTYTVSHFDERSLAKRLQALERQPASNESLEDLLALTERKLLGGPLTKAEELVVQASELTGKPRTEWSEDPLVAAHQIEALAETQYGTEPKSTEAHKRAKEAEKLCLRAVACARFPFIPPAESGAEAIVDRVEQLEVIAYGAAKKKTERTCTISVGNPLEASTYLGDAKKPSPEQSKRLCDDARNEVARLIGFQP